MILLLSLTSIALGISLVALYIQYSKISIVSSMNDTKISELLYENQRLQEEKFEMIARTENLSATLKAKDAAQDEALRSSKAILYDLTNTVANQLIEVHKKEVNDARKQSEENIAKQASNFNIELQKVASLISLINKDFADSKAIVNNLQNALLSPSGGGALAEITLENLLKNSGLREGCDYKMQYSFDGAAQNKLRPDAVIFLPEDNLLVVDAKASQFLLSEDTSDELAKSMNVHLKNLISRDYTNELAKDLHNKKIKIRVVNTVMFLPTDKALVKLQEVDKNFMTKAWENNIYPVSPSGLMNILSIAKMHIGEKMRIDNYENIIHEITNLINSIGVISEHAFKLGNSLSSAVGNYDKFAASFNRNLISKVSKLKTLGAGGSNSKGAKLLERYQLVLSKNDIIELETPTEDSGANDTPELISDKSAS